MSSDAMNMPRSVGFAVVIPVFNEAPTVDQMIRRVLAAPYQKQTIVVDDGSTDETGDILRTWASRPGVLLLAHATNCGKSRAIRTGLEAASSEFIIIQDADLEYDPADYPALIQPLLKGQAELVLGSRYMNGGRSSAKWSFRAGVGALNLAVRLLYGVRLTDEATCYKAIRTEILRQMDLQCERFEFCPEVIAKACRMGLRIKEVPISYHPRTAQEGKKIRLRDGIGALRTLWRWRKWMPAAQPSFDGKQEVSMRVPVKPSPVVAGGFTLVELLVVLGIITLLIAILLPAIVRAQQQAVRGACLAHLQQIGHAEQQSAAEHLNHLPTGGWYYANQAANAPISTGGQAVSGAHPATPEANHDDSARNFARNEPLGRD